MLHRDDHINFMLMMLHGLPSSAQIHDPNRLTMAYFTISGLDLLNGLQQLDVSSMLDWVYSAQVLLPSLTHESSNGGCFLGFRGSPSIGTHFNPTGAPLLLHDGGHLPSTYSALSILKILGDDFSRLQKDALLSSMKMLQQADGSFTSVHTGAEADLRFVYCAVVISTMLKDWSGMDIEKAFKYIMDCQSYDDGFGLCPGLESHGGATYCAVSALLMMGYITFDASSGNYSSSAVDVNALIKWCIQRQSETGGFQGRANKPSDTCYAFWIQGTLHLLGMRNLCDADALSSFLMSCQYKYGGFSKYPGEVSDILHAYYGLCGMSLLGEPLLKKLCCEFGISIDAVSNITIGSN